MNPRASALLSVAVIALLAGCSSTPPPSPATGASSRSHPTMTATASGPEAALQKGMTAVAVKRIMGEPAEIKPMQSPTGKAEIWVYRRTTLGSVRQVQVGTKTTPIYTKIGTDGQPQVLQSFDEPIFRQQREIIDETINLLMFDDSLVEQNRSVQKRMEY